MKTITLNSFYSDIRKYISFVLKGEEIIISRQNKPIIHVEPVSFKNKRPVGLAEGQFKVPDDFNCDLPDEILNNFK